jgi:hypothetical protein
MRWMCHVDRYISDHRQIRRGGRGRPDSSKPATHSNAEGSSSVRLMKLRLSEVVFLFVLGVLASLVGDHAHVSTGTTAYLSNAVPYVWSSAIWFPLLVGSATVSLAELRLHLPTPRPTVSARQGLGGVAAVVGTYVVTALVHSAPAFAATVLIYALAVLTWCVLSDGPGAVCGVLAAVGGPAFEAVLTKIGVAKYATDSDALFGVAPWLPALYFAFGVVAALLAEIAAQRRHPIN